jgi:DNA-binding beta-propeller fold protein YncE
MAFVPHAANTAKSPLRLVAVDKTGSRLCLIETESLEVLKRLPMPVAPHDLALDSAGDRLYVSIYGNGVYGNNPAPGREIIVIDAASFAQIESISTAPYTSPHGLAFDREGMLWVSCDAHSCVLGIDLDTHSVRHVVSTGSSGSHWLLASTLTGFLYTSNKQDRFISVIDPAKRELRRIINLPHGSEGICISPNGQLLYVADRELARILVVDLSIDAVTHIIDLVDLGKLMELGPSRRDHHMRLCVSSDGFTLAVAAYHFDRLILVDIPDPRRQTALHTGKGPMAMAFDPSNKTNLYISNHDDETMSIVDLRQRAVVRTVDCGGGIEAMRFL